MFGELAEPGARVFLNAGGLGAYQFPLRGRLLFEASSIDRLRHFGQFLGRNYAGVDIIGVGVVGVNGDALAVVLNTPLSTLRRFAAKMSLLILLPNPLPFYG